MKTPLSFYSIPLSLALVVAPQISSAEPTAPTGQLSANKQLVFSGVKPELTWDVTYPDLPFDPPTGTTTEDVTVFVSVFGVALQNSDGSEIPASARIKIGNSWHNLFSGYGSNVNPGQILFTKNVDKGTVIKMAAQGSNWGERNSDGAHVVVLKNGDTPPVYAPALNQGDIVSFLSGYISNGKVSIGPKDVIYLAELYSTNTGSYWYDMQDIVVHVRFQERTTYTPNN